MKRLLLSVFILTPLIARAQSASVTFPSVTFTSPVSTAITCNQNTPAGGWVVPVAAGTVIFSCTVTPPAWQGGVNQTGLNPPFGVGGLSGSQFNIIITSAVTTAGTVNPGSVSAMP